MRCCRTALGRCTCGGAAKSKNRGFMYSDSCFLPLPRSWHCISSAHICAGSAHSVSRRPWRRSEGSNRMRYSLHGCPCGMQSTCCSLTGHIFLAASPSLHSAFWAYTSCKREKQMRDTAICEHAPSETPKSFQTKSFML